MDDTRVKAAIKTMSSVTAQLARRSFLVSHFPDDLPVSTPKTVIRLLARSDDRCGELAGDLSRAHAVVLTRLRAAEAALSEKDAEIERLRLYESELKDAAPLRHHYLTEALND